MFLCKGYGRNRINLSCSRFYSTMELFHKMRRLDRSIPIWIEYGPNMYQPITNDTELRFACQMVEGDIESNMPSEDREQHQRDLADYSHTKDFDFMRRSQKRSSGKKQSAKKISTFTEDPAKEIENCEMSSVVDEDTLCGNDEA